MLNKIFLIGNIGQNPDIKEVGGTKVANFSIGVTKRGYTKKDGTKVEDKTYWFNCQAWQGKAEIIEKYVKKGDRLHVEGEMTYRKYEKDGVEKVVWEVLVSDIVLLTQKSSSGAAPTESAQNNNSFTQATANDGLPF